MKHVAVVANKWWEANPLCSVLLDDRARPAECKNIKLLHYPTSRVPRPIMRPPDPMPAPRMSMECGSATIDIWCLEELMNPFESSSSSLEKARVLPPALASREFPDLVIAFGTAGSRPGVSANGTVVVGRRIFTHDPLAAAPNRGGMWSPPHADEVLDSHFNNDWFRRIDSETKYRAEARLLSAPVAPSLPPFLLLGNAFIAVGIVNITNYDQYFWADRSAVTAFEEADVRDGQIGSVETTHGVIRASCNDAPFLFVSGIVDMEGLFDYQVTPRVYAQNFVGAHNAAVAVAFLLPELVRLMERG